MKSLSLIGMGSISVLVVLLPPRESAELPLATTGTFPIRFRISSTLTRADGVLVRVANTRSYTMLLTGLFRSMSLVINASVK
jgi:hypothetical protein